MDNQLSSQTNIVEKILNSYKTSIIFAVKSLPASFFLFTLISFIMLPTHEKSIFLYGVIIVSILGVLTTRMKSDLPNDHFFEENFLSFHGLALGYIGGYNAYKSFRKYETAFGLGSIIFTIILTILMVHILYSDKNYESTKKIPIVGASVVIGFGIGCLFSHLQFNLKQNNS